MMLNDCTKAKIPTVKAVRTNKSRLYKILMKRISGSQTVSLRTGRQTIAAAALLHLVNERRHDSCATATQRMTERDGAAVDVQFLEIDAEFTCARQYLRGEGFVQLNEINLIDG